MNNNWIRRALEYHGLPLKSIWEGERGEEELSALGLNNIDYSTHRGRQTSQSLAERRVRSKLHQFIAKNAETLFDQNQIDAVSSTTTLDGSDRASPVSEVLSKAPPFECFVQGECRSERVDRIYNVSKVPF